MSQNICRWRSRTLYLLLSCFIGGCSVLWPGQVPPPGDVQMQNVEMSPGKQTYYEQLAIPVSSPN